jgi:hypothetical protein
MRVDNISDADNIEDYVLVLRGILYVHEKDKSFSGRSFHLSCSSQNGRFNSNVMDIKVYFVLIRSLKLLCKRPVVKEI